MLKASLAVQWLQLHFHYQEPMKEWGLILRELRFHKPSGKANNNNNKRNKGKHLNEVWLTCKELCMSSKSLQSHLTVGNPMDYH